MARDMMIFMKNSMCQSTLHLQDILSQKGLVIQFGQDRSILELSGYFFVGDSGAEIFAGVISDNEIADYLEDRDSLGVQDGPDPYLDLLRGNDMILTISSKTEREDRVVDDFVLALRDLGARSYDPYTGQIEYGPD